jgi:hypothetical protein
MQTKKENIEEFEITNRSSEKITIGVKWDEEEVYYYDNMNNTTNILNQHYTELPGWFQDFMKEYDDNILPLIANMGLFEELCPTNFELVEIKRTY